MILVKILIATQSLFGFTLMYAEEPSFPANEIRVDYFTGNCPASYNLEAYIPVAIDSYWNTVSNSRLKLKVGTKKSEELGTSDNLFVTCGTEYYFTNLGSGILGYASIGYTGEKITGSTIFIRAGIDWSQYSDARKINVLAHEIGHGIGLGHSETRQATMVSGDPGKYEMDFDDHAAIQYLYGRKEFSGGIYGCGSLGGNHTETDLHFSSMLVLIPILLSLILKFNFRKRLATTL